MYIIYRYLIHYILNIIYYIYYSYFIYYMFFISYIIYYVIYTLFHIYTVHIHYIHISYGTEHYITTFSDDIQPHGVQPEVSCKQGTGGARAKENLGEKTARLQKMIQNVT